MSWLVTGHPLHQTPSHSEWGKARPEGTSGMVSGSSPLNPQWLLVMLWLPLPCWPCDRMRCHSFSKYLLLRPCTSELTTGQAKVGAPASDLGEPKPACCLQTMPWAASKTFSRYQVSWFVNTNVYYREPVDRQGPDHPRHGHPITCCHQYHVTSIVNTDDPQVALGNRHRLCVTSGLQRALGASGGGGGVNAAATMTTVCRFPKTLNTQLHMTRQFHAYVYTQRG